MKILYISSIPLPSPFANRLQVVKMSEAFSKKCEFKICLSTIKTSKQDVFKYYNITDSFNIIELGKAPKYLRTILYGLKALRIIRLESPDFLFIREAPLAFFLSCFYKNIIFEVHDFPEKKFFLFKTLFKRVYKIISTNRWKAEKLNNVFSIDQNKIFYVPNGVDIDYFNIDITKQEARDKLGLPQGRKLIIYTGSLFSWKGGDILLAAEKFLPDEYKIIFIGGTKKDQLKIKNKFSNYNKKKVEILAHQPYNLMRYYLKSADILVFPNTAKEDIAKFYTSPIKLFEYLASKRPVVCADLPSTREVVSNNEVLFFTPDDSKDLANKIISLSNNFVMQKKLVNNSFIKVQKYTWDKRVEEILNFIKK